MVSRGQRPRCGRFSVTCEATRRQYTAVGRALGRSFKNQGCSPCTALFFFRCLSLGVPFFEYERFELPSAFKIESSSQLLRKFYPEYGKQGEVEAGNFPN